MLDFLGICCDHCPAPFSYFVQQKGYISPDLLPVAVLRSIDIVFLYITLLIQNKSHINTPDCSPGAFIRHHKENVICVCMCNDD